MTIRAYIFAFAGMLVATSFAGVASAQQKKAAQGVKSPSRAADPDDQDTITFDSALVNTYVTVRDEKGRLVSGLKRDDFTVLDNGKLQPISYFSQESNQPLRVALVIDRSRSVEPELVQAQTAALDFFRYILRPGTDKAAVIAFDSGVYVLQDFTDSAPALMRAVSSLTASGGTSIFDAVYKTVRDKLPNSQDSRRVIILMTDGDDTASQASISDAIDIAIKNNVIVYAIRIPGERSLNVRDLQGKPVLDRLTEATGGRQFHLAGNQSQLSEFFTRLGDELRTQYSIGYQFADSAASPSFHKLTIRMRSASLRAFTRRGYYSGAQ